MGASRFATFIMKVLIIGDVVAKPGRVAVLERIQDLREQHEIDLAIMNAENLAGGFSVTPSLCEQLFAPDTRTSQSDTQQHKCPLRGPRLSIEVQIGSDQ